MHNISVGVLMTTFNGAEYLEEQLQSLVGQSGVDLALYVFDDGSTDLTIQILENFSELLKIKTVINRANSGGTGINLFQNLLLYQADLVNKHDYFAFCDQDDIWDNEKLFRAHTCLVESNSALYFSNLTKWNPDDGTLGEIDKAHRVRRFDHIFSGGSAGCTYVFTNSFLKTLIGHIECLDFLKATRISHDWVTYYIARISKSCVFIDSQSFIKYRIHSGSQYGGLSNVNIYSVAKKYRMLKAGFYKLQFSNYLAITPKTSDEYMILKRLQGNYFQKILLIMELNLELSRTKSRLCFIFLITFLGLL